MTVDQEHNREQLKAEVIANLEKQAYRIVGSHSVVKTCGWTKKSIRGEGTCYKHKFYGIVSNQCLQMSTSMSCANRCTFCWRDYKAPVEKDWQWVIDEPQKIFDGCVKEHHQLLIGFKGNKKEDAPGYEKSREIKHVALSLVGEPIIYPRINELLELFNKKGISTFMVTNAQYAEQIRDLKPVTQLYLSIDAPNKKLLKEIDKPLFTDYWERMLKSLEYTAQKKQRTCIRLTLIKGVNMVEPENYAKLIKLGDPDFIEAKGYMFIGASRQRLDKDNMPYHEEVVEFSQKLALELPDYEIVSEQVASRVVMLAKKKFKIKGHWYTWIDFKKWHEIVNSGKEPLTEEYMTRTPVVGISGKKANQIGVHKEIKDPEME